MARWIAPRRIGFWATVVNAAAIVLLLVASCTSRPATVVVAMVDTAALVAWTVLQHIRYEAAFSGRVRKNGRALAGGGRAD